MDESAERTISTRDKLLFTVQNWEMKMKNRIKMSVGLLLALICFGVIHSKDNKYENFLKGKGTTAYLKEEQYSITELTEETQGNYILCDITEDGKAELHLKTKRNYFIIEENEDSLMVIYDGSAYDNLICNENISGILYFRQGGAPDNCIYQFYDLGLHGEIENHEEFNWYDDNENHVMDEKDMYIRNDSFISMDEWTRQTEEYSGLLEQSMNQWQEWHVE